MPIKNSLADLPSFVSTQVTDSRRFFLDLNPNRRTPMQVVCGGVERVETRYVVDRTDFPYYAVEVVAQGEGDLTIDGEQSRLQPGSVFAYGPGVAHRIRNRGKTGMRKYYVDFIGSQAKKLLIRAGLLSEHHRFETVNVGAVHEVTALLDMLILNANNPGSLVNPICSSLLQILSLKIAQLRLPKGRSVPRAYATFVRVRSQIDERFLELHTIQEVAAECDLTPEYLSALFKRFSEIGAHQYLMRQKMNFAAGLLMSERMQVQDVARRLNMPDAFQFSKAFNRAFGLPPSELREQAQTDRLNT